MRVVVAVIVPVLTISGAMAGPPDSGIIQPIYEEHIAPAPAEPGIPPPPDAQARVNGVVAQSLRPINECYRGVHTTFNDDIVDRALGKLFKEVAKPGGLCDQYQKHAADIPLEVSVPLLPGVSANTEKLCKLLQHPTCDK